MAGSRKNTDLLDSYESLVSHRGAVATQKAALTDELDILDKRLVEVRALLRSALHGETTSESEKTAGHKRGGTARSRVRISDYQAKLAEADPRVQRSLRKVFRILQRKEMKECTAQWLATALKISYQAARQRLTRGVTLGVFEKISPSTYAVTF